MTDLSTLEGWQLQPIGGSFRDPANRVYCSQSTSQSALPRILRGVDETSLKNFVSLEKCAFYKRLIEEGRIVATSLVSDEVSTIAKKIKQDGWVGILEHQRVPFVTYPYEWTFGMLRQAALLHLRILEDALVEGWMLKDSSPYNIQFVGSRPVFIDIPSFEPREEGKPWLAYRQFCSCFLTPLMLRAYLGIDHLPIMRSYMDGIPPAEAVKFFKGISRFRKGVVSHIILPSYVENRILSKERDDSPVKDRTTSKHAKAMLIGLVQSMRRIVKRLSIDMDHTDWSEYATTHSYEDSEMVAKKNFVKEIVATKAPDVVWDIGCNTGNFSRLCAQYAKYVLALDGDHNAIEKLFKSESCKQYPNIQPLVMNLANISPNQGWGGIERTAFDARGKPDVVLVLALVHHIRISASIPLDLFLAWLRQLDAQIVIEFVNRNDEMVVKLLTNKEEQYLDYNLETFIRQAEKHFKVEKRCQLKGGKRELFHLIPQ